MAGSYDLAIAGGVEVMSLVGIGSATRLGVAAGCGHPDDSEGFRRRYGKQEISQFRAAELIAQRWGLTRAALEGFALRSHRLAAQAWDQGRFDREVVPVAGLRKDETVRRDTSLEQMSALPLLPGRVLLTAGMSSPLSDGAAALLIASERAIDKYGLVPRAQFKAFGVVGSDPVTMLTGPIPATAEVLAKARLQVGDVDLFEVNEAFAPVVLAWLAETGAALDKTNVNGGAIALGHPIGATGARLMTTLLHELERTGGRFGLQVMCEGGGTANATIIERV
jgi:acetyl-CoA C-acetyltransferase